MRNKNLLNVAIIGSAIFVLLTALVKFTDAFDYLVDRSKPIQTFREQNAVQKQINENMIARMDDLKNDTKSILKELRRH